MNETRNIPRWGMVVDLNRCVGCQTCTIACKHANDTLPGVQWRRVLDVEQGTYPNVQREFLVTGCQHCAVPPCVPVCPTGATVQRADGLITMDYDQCIGCGYCAVACPYQARTIVHDQKWFYGVETIQEQAVQHAERMGVVQKCTFCIERVDEGVEAGFVPGVDLDYTPVCSASCIASAIHFGDFNDPDSNVSHLTADNAAFQMHEKLGTDPQIKYLYETPAVPGRLNPASLDSNEATIDPADPLAGERQTFWDFRAAMNFILGGMGSGLAFCASFWYFEGSLATPLLRDLYVLAAIMMAIGLFCVFLEIGRKRRFLYVLLRPQSSWMTRETYFVVLFYPALITDLILPQLWLHSLVGVAGLGFLVCQARIMYAGKGIPAWRAPLIPWLIIFTGLLEGSGLLLLGQLLRADLHPGSTLGLTVVTGLLALVTGCMWGAYCITARSNGLSPAARQELQRVCPFVTIIGHLIPAIGLMTLAFTGNTARVSAVITICAGFGAVSGGALWKYIVTTRAAYQQGFDMPWLPQRGSGNRAAPYREGYKSSAFKV